MGLAEKGLSPISAGSEGKKQQIGCPYCQPRDGRYADTKKASTLTAGFLAELNSESG